MSDKTTSQENLSGAIADVDSFRGVQGGLNVRVTFTLVKAWIVAWLTPYLIAGGFIREMLTADRTYYVRLDGSDANTGLVNSAGGAFLTLQKAYNTIVSRLDLGGFTVTIQVANGTRTDGLIIQTSWTGGGIVQILGDAVTPSNVVISRTNGECFFINASLSGLLIIAGFKMTTISSGSAINHVGVGTVYLGKNDFGACVTRHINIGHPAAQLIIGSSYTISGGADRHYYCNSGGALQFIGPYTVTVIGTPAFTIFASFETRALGMVSAGAGVSFSGGATGTRYSVQENSVSRVDGGGPNFFPGSVAGSTATGGQYV